MASSLPLCAIAAAVLCVLAAGDASDHIGDAEATTSVSTHGERARVNIGGAAGTLVDYSRTECSKPKTVAATGHVEATCTLCADGAAREQLGEALRLGEEAVVRAMQTQLGTGSTCDPPVSVGTGMCMRATCRMKAKKDKKDPKAPIVKGWSDIAPTRSGQQYKPGVMRGRTGAGKCTCHFCGGKDTCRAGRTNLDAATQAECESKGTCMVGRVTKPYATKAECESNKGRWTKGRWTKFKESRSKKVWCQKEKAMVEIMKKADALIRKAIAKLRFHIVAKAGKP